MVKEILSGVDDSGDKTGRNTGGTGEGTEEDSVVTADPGFAVEDFVGVAHDADSGVDEHGLEDVLSQKLAGGEDVVFTFYDLGGELFEPGGVRGDAGFGFGPVRHLGGGVFDGSSGAGGDDGFDGEDVGVAVFGDFLAGVLGNARDVMAGDPVSHGLCAHVDDALYGDGRCEGDVAFASGTDIEGNVFRLGPVFHAEGAGGFDQVAFGAEIDVGGGTRVVDEDVEGIDFLAFVVELGRAEVPEGDFLKGEGFGGEDVGFSFFGLVDDRIEDEIGDRIIENLCSGGDRDVGF